MKIYFLLSCLFFQTFCHNPLSIALNDAPKKTVFGVIDHVFARFEWIEEKTPSLVKMAGDISIDLFYTNGIVLKFFLIKPHLKITSMLCTPIDTWIIETNFIQKKLTAHLEKLLETINSNIKKYNDFKEIIQLYDLLFKRVNKHYNKKNNGKKEINKEREDTNQTEFEKLVFKHKALFSKDVMRRFISIVNFQVVFFILNRTWHRLKQKILQTLPIEHRKNYEKIITIFETTMPSRICFLPINLHKCKAEINALFAIIR